MLTPRFEAGELSIPVIEYAPNFVAKVVLQLDFETMQFKVKEFTGYDCLIQIQQTYFSPYPTATNYNPCDFR